MRKYPVHVIMILAALSVAGCVSSGKGKARIGKGKGKTPVVHTRG